jgi:hypothetical protein
MTTHRKLHRHIVNTGVTIKITVRLHCYGAVALALCTSSHRSSCVPQVRCKFGSFDMIQELDNNRKIRQCNWVRFVIATEDRLANTCSSLQAAEGETKCSDGLEANMTAVLVDGQPVFEVTRSILPHTPIVVQFQGLSVHSGSAPAELQGNCSVHIRPMSCMLF